MIDSLRISIHSLPDCTIHILLGRYHTTGGVDYCAICWKPRGHDHPYLQVVVFSFKKLENVSKYEKKMKNNMNAAL